jgi:hypothetical protein
VCVCVFQLVLDFDRLIISLWRALGGSTPLLVLGSFSASPLSGSIAAAHSGSPLCGPTDKQRAERAKLQKPIENKGQAQSSYHYTGSRFAPGRVQIHTVQIQTIGFNPLVGRGAARAAQLRPRFQDVSHPLNSAHNPKSILFVNSRWTDSSAQHGFFSSLHVTSRNTFPI